MADDGINDEVTLELAGEEVLKATSWDIRQSVLSQPGEFNLRLGQGPTISALIGAYPPGTPFRLSINNALRMTGRTDGFRATGADATELNIFGRDALAPIHDAHITGEKSFTDSKYSTLVEAVLKEVGLDPALLVVTDGNRANRKVMSGVPIRELAPARIIDEILADVSPAEKGSTVHAAQAQSLQAKIGERWYEFVRRHLDRAGLMLWAAGDGKFILTAPNVAQAPVARILRRRGQLRNDVNVISADLLHDTRPRFSYAIVYGRGGGRRAGRSTAKGDAFDREMVDLGYGNPVEINQPNARQKLPAKFISQLLEAENARKAAPPTATKKKTIIGNSRALVIRDANCQNQAQAAYLASRKLAEARRHGYQLVYTLAGLSSPSLVGGGRQVWTPDTIVEVIDDEFGIDDVFWIESTEFRRSPQSQTTIRLMRTTDVLFGSAD